MDPIRKLPVKLQLGDKEYCDDFHIYRNIQGALTSWKACKQLHILPECYPHPITHLDHYCIIRAHQGHQNTYQGTFHQNMQRTSALPYLMDRLEAWKVKSFTSP